MIGEGIITTASVAIPALLALVGYRTVRRNQVAKVLLSFGGRIPLASNAITFQFEGKTFMLRRHAVGGGPDGSWASSTLTMLLDHGTPLVISHTAAIKHIYEGRQAPHHSTFYTPCARLAVITKAHAVVASSLYPLAGILSRLLPRPHSTVRLCQERKFTWPWLVEHQWTLQVSGLPDGIYQDTDELKTILRDAGSLWSTLDRAVPSNIAGAGA
jgi:hypothetical protein